MWPLSLPTAPVTRCHPVRTTAALDLTQRQTTPSLSVPSTVETRREKAYIFLYTQVSNTYMRLKYSSFYDVHLVSQSPRGLKLMVDFDISGRLASVSLQWIEARLCSTHIITSWHTVSLYWCQVSAEDNSIRTSVLQNTFSISDYIARILETMHIQICH